MEVQGKIYALVVSVSGDAKGLKKIEVTDPLNPRLAVSTSLDTNINLTGVNTI